ncbi:MAG: carbamoyltransferase C-terminal domain-containing protein [Flavobacteriaceae bacterium]
MIDTNKALKVLLDQKPLVIFHGKSEWGPRALGNRSILFDARNKDAKEIVNKFKRREWWRPLAGTVIEQHADKYFDMGSLKASPYMSFAVRAKPRALNEVPSIVHVDGTCRVQTINKGPLYDLLTEFYRETDVPILLNTSFNLAGFPIVENKEFLEFTVRNSEFKDVYEV